MCIKVPTYLLTSNGYNTSHDVASLCAGLTLMIYWAGRRGYVSVVIACIYTTAVICPDCHLLSVWSCYGAAVNQ